MKGTKTPHDNIRFSSKDCPVDGKFQGKGWNDLKGKLCMTTIDAGFQLYSNGSISTKGYRYDLRQLKCTNCRQISLRHQQCINSNIYRNDYTSNNRKWGNRNDGIRLPRRQPSVRPTELHSLCPFNFFVGVDESSFFQLGDQGNLEHKGHLCLKEGEIKVPTRFLCASERKSILKVTGSGVSYTSAHNVYYITSGRMLSAHDIAYIHGLNRKLLQISDDSCENNGIYELQRISLCFSNPCGSLL